MRNIKLTIEYDGTNYHGWQVQPGQRTIQGTLLAAIQDVTREKVNLIGAGRTDAGVHALGQVANFRTGTRIPLQQLPFALNSCLPSDIAVKEAQEVPMSFHARFDARSKTYRYLVWNHRIRPAIHRNHYAWVRVPLNFKEMRDAAGYFRGTHDFESFASEAREKNSVRTVKSIELKKNGHLIQLEMSADGFLYNMVRSIMGTLLDVGRGYRSIEDIPRMLEQKDRRCGGPTAPASGLYLVKVDF